MPPARSTLNADLLLRAHPKPAEVAIVVNQLTNLIGGESHLYNRGAVSRSLSGYYRMFTERNITVDFVNAVDLTAARTEAVQAGRRALPDHDALERSGRDRAVCSRGWPPVHGSPRRLGG